MSCRGSHFGFPIKKKLWRGLYKRNCYHVAIPSYILFHGFLKFQPIRKHKPSSQNKNCIQCWKPLSNMTSLVQFAQFLRQWLTHIKLTDTDDRCKMMITYQLTFGPGKLKTYSFGLCIKCDVIYSCTLHNK
jgi:hypothetical protein